MRKTGIPYAKPSDDTAPSAPPSLRKNPAKDEAVNMTPIEKTTNGKENPRNSKGTVSRSAVPSGMSPVGKFATILDFNPHLIDKLHRAKYRLTL